MAGKFLETFKVATKLQKNKDKILQRKTALQGDYNGMKKDMEAVSAEIETEMKAQMEERMRTEWARI